MTPTHPESLTPLSEAERMALGEAAEKATPGSWNVSRSGRFVKKDIGSPWVCEVDQSNKAWRENGAFIALANPATVKRLLSERDALAGEADQLRFVAALLLASADQAWMTNPRGVLNFMQERW